MTTDISKADAAYILDCYSYAEEERDYAKAHERRAAEFQYAAHKKLCEMRGDFPLPALPSLESAVGPSPTLEELRRKHYG